MDLTNFLKTGTYLKLKVGLSEENIYSCFKKKDLSKKYYYNKLDKNEGFSYFYGDGALEIMVIDSKIYSLQFDPARYPYIFTLFNNIIISHKTSFELIIKYLDIADIKWSFYQRYCHSRELTIKTEENIFIGCVYDKGDYKLSKFQVFEDLYNGFF